MTATDPSQKDGAAVRFPPPLVSLIAMGCGVIAHRLLWPFPIPLDGVARWGVAGVLLLAGIALVGAAFGLFRKTGQNPEPWASTPEIITTGVYRYTRNPMYVAFGLIQAGIGVALANAWIVLFIPLASAAIQRIAIRHEEAYLERKFGDVYTDYKASVRRWL